MNVLNRIVALTAVMLLTACQAVGPRPAHDTGPIEEMEALLDEQAQAPEPVAPPPEVLDAMLPSLDDAAEVERFDLAVVNVPARDFFLGLVKGTGINMVVHPEVEGLISLDLQDVSIDEVMTVVRDVYGYPWRRQGRLYQVLPAGLRTEIFKVDYLNVRRRGQSETEVRAGQVSDAGEASTGRRGTLDDPSVRDDNQAQRGRRGIVGTRIETSAEADFWRELQNTLELIIGDREDRRVVVTPQAGMVVVRAMPGELESVRHYLEKAELTMQRQVILEAKILEVQLNEGFQSGIDWTAIDETSNRTIGVSQGGGDLATLNNLNGVFGVALDTGGEFAGLIELLSTQGNVQVLSSPRIATVNNQKAVIKVGTDEFFVTEVSTVSTTSAAGVVTQPNIELTPFFSGIALDVTPQISDEDEIILHIHPSVSEVVDQNKTVTLGNETLDLPLALSTIRESDSIVYARSGQVVVIGGLMQTSARDTSAGPPGLSKVPGLGHLFRQTRQESVKSELVILLRPLVSSPDVWRDLIKESSDRMGGLRSQLEPWWSSGGSN